MTIKKRGMALCSVMILGLFLVVPSGYAANGPELYGGVEYFTWREFDDFGQILKESGPRFAVGFTMLHEFPNHLTLKPRIEIFGGGVDYQGAACDRYLNCLPVDSTSYYFGLKLEGDVGSRVQAWDNLFIEPFGGLGIRVWSRSLDDAALSDGTYAVGYTEDWTTFYGRMGLRLEQQLSSQDQIFLEAGVKLPIRTTNYIDDPDVSYHEITLRPRNRPSFFAEAGLRINRFRISAFYDSMKFKESNPVDQYDPYSGYVIRYVQPRSESEMIGVRLGAAFY